MLEEFSKFNINKHKMALFGFIFFSILIMIILVFVLSQYLNPVKYSEPGLCFNDKYETEFASNGKDIRLTKQSYDLLVSEIKLNGYKEIENIAQLTCLTYFELKDSEVTDISQIGKLVNLSKLTLSKNNITDISFLKSLDKLVLLDLGYNQIKDVSVFNNFNNLEFVALNNNLIEDISIFEKIKVNRLLIHKNLNTKEACVSLKNNFLGESVICS